MATPGARYPYDIHSTLEPWRHELGHSFDQVVSALADRDRSLEDTLDLWLQRYAARATSSTNTALLAGAWTNVTLDNVTHDEYPAFAASTYKAPSDGLYDVTGTVHIEPYVPGQADFAVRFTYGTAPGVSYGNQLSLPAGGIGHILVVSDQVVLSRGDVVTFQAMCSQATTVSVFPALGLPRLTVRRVGPKP